MSDQLGRMRRAKVTKILHADAEIQRVEVESDLFIGAAVSYPMLTGGVEAGDEVLVNTTAVDLGLGTGGVHFVIANLSRNERMALGPGHIMKLRYTPHQVNVWCVEEENHPEHELIAVFDGLQGKPVILGMLHSMIAPAAAGVKATREGRPDPSVSVAYTMTDSASLPIEFSSLVRELKATGLVDVTVTCGQAFGGDREAVNLYTALAAASDCDVIIVAPGPGHVGTGTTFGFSGIEQGHSIDAVNQLGGRPIVIPRISFADSRERHHGVSHHTVTILTRACETNGTVVLPQLPQKQSDAVRRKLRENDIHARHTIVTEDGNPALQCLKRLGIEAKSMGRVASQDPAFFLAAGAAGVYARSLARGGYPFSRR